MCQNVCTGGDGMTWTDQLFIAILSVWYAVIIYGIDHNTRENHQHLHQIGCHVGIEGDCKWMKEKD